MTPLVVLDAAAFDFLPAASGRQFRDLLRQQAERGGQVHCAAVTLAEVCSGVRRTRTVEAALVRAHGGQRIRVIPTDEKLAKLVGAILHNTGNGSEKIADAHVVAACAAAENTLVITGDPDDINDLAAALPGCRIVTRDPGRPLIP